MTSRLLYCTLGPPFSFFYFARSLSFKGGGGGSVMVLSIIKQ